ASVTVVQTCALPISLAYELHGIGQFLLQAPAAVKLFRQGTLLPLRFSHPHTLQGADLRRRSLDAAAGDALAVDRRDEKRAAWRRSEERRVGKECTRR